MALLAVVSFGETRRADAQDTGQWVRVGEQVVPGGDPAPPGYVVTLSATSMTVVENFGPEYPDGGEATFEASWRRHHKRSSREIPSRFRLTVSGRNTGNLDTQYFFGLDVILIVDGRWNREAVGVVRIRAEIDRDQRRLRLHRPSHQHRRDVDQSAHVRRRVLRRHRRPQLRRRLLCRMVVRVRAR